MPDARPHLVFVVHTLSPFRLHIQRRIAREIPEVRLSTLVSWSQQKHLWKYGDLPEIGAVTFPEGVDELDYNVTPLRARLTDWHAGKQLVAWAKANRPDAVVFCGYEFPSHYRLLRSIRKQHIPFMLWSDSNILGDTAAGPKRLLKNTLVRPLVREAAAVLPCGTRGSEYYARYGATPDRTFFCPVEPDYSLIEHASTERLDEARRSWNLDPARKRFLIGARLVDLKSIDLAIDAFASIASQRPDWDLFIVGDGPLRQSLEARVPAPLKSRVVFTGFLTDQALVAAIERQCHVLVHAGYWEAWGVVLLEAAAAGLAIVASTAIGAAADLVRDQVSGRIIPPRDPQALAAALLEVSDPARLPAMQAASLEISRDFRHKADPIRGLRAALAKANVLRSTS